MVFDLNIKYKMCIVLNTLDEKPKMSTTKNPYPKFLCHHI